MRARNYAANATTNERCENAKCACLAESHGMPASAACPPQPHLHPLLELGQQMYIERHVRGICIVAHGHLRRHQCRLDVGVHRTAHTRRGGALWQKVTKHPLGDDACLQCLRTHAARALQYHSQQGCDNFFGVRTDKGAVWEVPLAQLLSRVEVERATSAPMPVTLPCVAVCSERPARSRQASA